MTTPDSERLDLGAVLSALTDPGGRLSEAMSDIGANLRAQTVLGHVHRGEEEKAERALRDLSHDELRRAWDAAHAMANLTARELHRRAHLPGESSTKDCRAGMLACIAMADREREPTPAKTCGATMGGWQRHLVCDRPHGHTGRHQIWSRRSPIR